VEERAREAAGAEAEEWVEELERLEPE